MKKRFFTLLVALASAMTFISASATDTGTTDAGASSTTGAGGLDFYSITINYTGNVLVDYVKESKKYLFVNSEGTQVVSDKFVYRAGVTKALDYIGYDKTDPSLQTNFYQLLSVADGITADAHYSKFPERYSYITHIQDGAILKSKERISLYGIIAPYDEGEPYVNQNPNLEYNSDGYALDANTDSDGNPYRIDINTYRITKDGLWLDSEGRRVELYYQKARYVCTGANAKGTKPMLTLQFVDEYEPVPYSLRFDENGKIRDISEIQYTLYISDDELDAFGEANMNSATPKEPAYLYFQVADAAMLEQLEDKTFARDYETETVSPRLFRVTQDKVQYDESGAAIVGTDGKNTTVKIPDEEYYSTSFEYTMDDILLDDAGRLVNGTPVIGTPKLKVAIKSITIETDALGSQTYTDATQDPQNNNTITVSLNDFAANCEAKKAALDENYITQETYDNFSSTILGTVNSKTTSTAVDWNEENCTDTYKSTVTSLDLNLTEEQIAALPYYATFYLNFKIETHQPDEAFDTDYIQFTSKKDQTTTLLTENATSWKRPAEKLPVATVEDTSGTNWILIGSIAGGVVVVAGVVTAIAVVSSKKKKNAA